MNVEWSIAGIILYLILAPAIGILLAGVDRKISARMQSRRGPPLLQPYYDVRKMLEKEQITVNRVQDYYVVCALIFTIITGCIFFSGGDLLLTIFTLAMAEVFLVLAAYSSGSPYSQVGAERELYMMMSYEPMILLTIIGFYLLSGEFSVYGIMNSGSMAFPYLIGIFIGFVYILTMKFRKSPFDLSMSHHAHQDLVRGLTTEFSGRSLAAVEVSHWFENVMLLGLVFLFFCNGELWGYILGLIACVMTYLLEIYIDNCFARMKWQVALKSGWIVALVFGVLNVLMIILLL